MSFFHSFISLMKKRRIVKFSLLKFLCIMYLFTQSVYYLLLLSRNSIRLSCAVFEKIINFFQTFFFTFRSLSLLLLSLRYGIRTSPAQFFFYFFSLITGAATLRSIIFRKMESDSDDNYDPNDDNETLINADYIELDTVHCNCCFAEKK